MRSFILPSMIEVIADPSHQIICDFALFVHVVLAVHDLVIHFCGRRLNLLNQLHKLGSKPSKNIIHFSRFHARLKRVHQCVIRAIGKSDAVRLFALNIYNLFKPRLKRLEIVRFSCFNPLLVRKRSDLHLFDC